MESIYLTHAGADKLRKDLDQLVNILRPEATENLAVARAKGDLSENAEYDAARERLAELDRQIGNLQAKFAFIQIVDESKINSDEVRILSTVKLTNLKTNTSMNITLVDPVQSDPQKNLLSFKSPIGKGILGKKVGDIAGIEVPAGKIELRIDSIGRSTEM
jgi:transcription elongation factor GreA